MITIDLNDVNLELSTNRETGIRTLRLIDPGSGIRVQVQMDEVGAQQLAAGLAPEPRVEIVKPTIEVPGAAKLQ